jgi:hypothetical protein
MSWRVGWVVFAVFVGCADGPVEPPEGVLDQTAFVRVMADIQLLEAGAKKRLRRQDDEDAIYRGQYLALFEAHGITEAEFKASHAWWFDHPELLVGVYDDVIEELNEWERAWGETEGQAPVRDRK